MDTTLLRTVQEQTQDLLRKSGFPLSVQEQAEFAINDFGLGDVLTEGFGFVDILRSPRVRVVVIVLLPNQTLPQHRHPPHADEAIGKEETLRVLHGHAKVYVEGEANNPDIRIPAGKDGFYTARHEIALDTGEQVTVAPNVDHWFQGGNEGAVCLTFQNRVDESQNIFADPHSLGCPIKLTD